MSQTYHLSSYLSIYLSTYLPTYLSIYLYIYIYIIYIICTLYHIITLLESNTIQMSECTMHTCTQIKRVASLLVRHNITWFDCRVPSCCLPYVVSIHPFPTTFHASKLGGSAQSKRHQLKAKMPLLRICSKLRQCLQLGEGISHISVGVDFDTAHHIFGLMICWLKLDISKHRIKSLGWYYPNNLILNSLDGKLEWNEFVIIQCWCVFPSMRITLIGLPEPSKIPLDSTHPDIAHPIGNPPATPTMKSHEIRLLVKVAFRGF